MIGLSTKFTKKTVGGWGFAPDPTGELTMLLHTPESDRASRRLYPRTFASAVLRWGLAPSPDSKASWPF